MVLKREEERGSLSEVELMSVDSAEEDSIAVLSRELMVAL